MIAGCRIALVAAATWTVLQAGAVAAAPPDVEGLIDRGRREFARGSFDRSIALLRRAERQAESDRDVALARLYIGLNRAVLGDQDAISSLVSALKLDPTLELDPSKYKPALVELLARARAGVKGTLVVSASRAHAVVLLDGKRRGEAPLRASVAVGKHRVKLQAGDATFEREVLITFDQTVNVEGDLGQPSEGALMVRTTPPGAMVWIGGRQIGITPIKVAIEAGAHRVRLRRAGYRGQVREVSVAPGASASVDLRLLALPPPESGLWLGRTWTWVAAASALAALGAGVAVGLSGQADYDEFESTQDPARYDQLKGRVSTKQTVANVLYIGAGVAAVTSVVLFFVEGRRPSRNTSGESVDLSALAAGIVRF